jgi:hypothetical protein
MASVLFLFQMTAFAETLELVWKERDIPILRVMTTANEHIVEGKFAATHQRCLNPKNSPRMRYCNVFMWTTAPFHSGQGRTCNAGWNSSFTDKFVTLSGVIFAEELMGDNRSCLTWGLGWEWLGR